MDRFLLENEMQSTFGSMNHEKMIHPSLDGTERFLSFLRRFRRNT